MRKIKLTQGLFTLVDDKDYNRLCEHKWYAGLCKGKYYAMRNGSPCGAIYMHREILKLKPGDGIKSDHKNPNKTLDNRRSNLRKSNTKQNSANIGIPKHNTSGFKGVSLFKRDSNYRATICINGKSILLGTRSTAREASKLYQLAAKKLHGEFARFK